MATPTSPYQVEVKSEYLPCNAVVTSTLTADAEAAMEEMALSSSTRALTRSMTKPVLKNAPTKTFTATALSWPSKLECRWQLPNFFATTS